MTQPDRTPTVSLAGAPAGRPRGPVDLGARAEKAASHPRKLGFQLGQGAG